MLELGAGVGFVSMCLAANLPEASRITATEQASGGATEWLASNMSRNTHLDLSKLHVSVCDWASFAPVDPCATENATNQCNQRNRDLQSSPQLCSSVTCGEVARSTFAMPQQPQGEGLADDVREETGCVAQRQEQTAQQPDNAGADPERGSASGEGGRDGVGHAQPAVSQYASDNRACCGMALRENSTLVSSIQMNSSRTEPERVSVAEQGPGVCEQHFGGSMPQSTPPPVGHCGATEGNQPEDRLSDPKTQRKCAVIDRCCTESWDFIVGSDLVYTEAGCELLTRTLAALVSDRTQVLYAHTKRRFEMLDQDFFAALSAAGLQWEEVREPWQVVSPPQSPPAFSSLFPDMRIAVLSISRRR